MMRAGSGKFRDSIACFSVRCGYIYLLGISTAALCNDAVN